jgi:hypothetical protein
VTYDRFEKLCGQLFIEHHCDPTELHLSNESRVELTTTLLAEQRAWVLVSADYIPADQIGGALLQKIVNPVTKSVISLEDGEKGLPDFFITRVYV